VQSTDLEKLFDNLDEVIKTKANRVAVMAAGGVVVQAAKQRVSRSAQTGSRKKNSKAYKQKHGEQPKPLADTIASELRLYKNGELAMAVVGAQYPAGAHAHLVERGHKMILWGRGYKQEKQVVDVRSDDELRAGAGQRGRRRLKQIERNVTTGGVAGFVQGKAFMAPAVDATRETQTQVAVEAVRKYIIAEGG
jgi:ABC-type glutathione transport system ATPase component